MYGKKQRIISFLMAFLLIFTFTFINPLTVQKADAFAFAPVLTANMSRIITGVLVSAGLGITAGQSLQEVDYDSAITAISSVVYRTLNGAQKIALGALSILDNVVEVPISLYNSIVNNAKKVFETEEYSQSLIEQGIEIKYATLSYNDNESLILPLYQLPNTSYPNLSEAQPFLIFDGSQSTYENSFDSSAITTNLFDVSTEDNPTLSLTDTTDIIMLSPSLESFGFTNGNVKPFNCIFLQKYATFITLSLGYFDDGVISYSTTIDMLSTSKDVNSNLSQYKIFYYFILYDGLIGVSSWLYENDERTIYGSRTNGISGSGINSVIEEKNIYDMPSGLDAEIIVESSPVPVITNTDATANVITLPFELSETIGLTSTDVNVEKTDIPGTDTGTGENTGTNTETMDNINTNVGELVTGGELGEQVNTNIGTVEGLHGEITSQVDFGAVFDTIAQYISSLDISSVTWFPVAVAGFISPFLPLISLGIILFFIDRVLNGGA